MKCVCEAYTRLQLKSSRVIKSSSECGRGHFCLPVFVCVAPCSVPLLITACTATKSIFILAGESEEKGKKEPIQLKQRLCI